MKVDPQGFPRKWVARSAKLKPFQPAEWHNMCADRVHAGVTMWAGKIPPVKRINRVALVEVSQRFGEPREKANKEKTTMKKLMVIAAAASIAAVAEAGIVVNTNCNPRSTYCPVVAFKVTASGKIAAQPHDKEYKTATKLSIKKGALVLFPTDQGTGTATDPDCCYNAYSLYLQVKVGKDTVPVGVFYEAIDSWSIFGKNYNKSLEASKSKKYKVESEIGLAYANTGNASTGLSSANSGNDTVVSGGPIADLDLGLNDFAFIATAFGKGTYAYRVTKATTSACNVCTPGTETYEFTPGSYSGWFAGLITDFGGDYGCLMCNCADLDVFGGTWKAKYDKTWSASATGWEKAASYVFGSGVLADMIENEIE